MRLRRPEDRLQCSQQHEQQDHHQGVRLMNAVGFIPPAGVEQQIHQSLSHTCQDEMDPGNSRFGFPATREVSYLERVSKLRATNRSAGDAIFFASIGPFPAPDEPSNRSNPGLISKSGSNAPAGRWLANRKPAIITHLHHDSLTGSNHNRKRPVLKHLVVSKLHARSSDRSFRSFG